MHVTSSIVCAGRTCTQGHHGTQTRSTAPYRHDALGLTFNNILFGGTGRWSGKVVSEDGENSSCSFNNFDHVQSLSSARVAKMCKVILLRDDNAKTADALDHEAPESDGDADKLV